MKPEFIPKLERYKKLSKLRAYYKSTQYEGRPDFFTGYKNGEVVPLRERKPCVIYPLARAVSGQVARFTFGEGRFPSIAVEEQEDDSYENLSLNEEEAHVLESGLGDIIEKCGVRPLMVAMMKRGISCKTAVAILSIKKGRIRAELAHAQDCFPTFENDDPNDDLTKLVWCYVFEKDVQGATGPERKKFWFRREVDDRAYYDWDPVEVIPGEIDVRWGSPTVTAHPFGFVPALWIRNLDEASCSNDIDGASLYEDFFEEIDALNFALSQRHRGVAFFGTPQPWEAGVADDDGPDADGRRASDGYSGSSKKAPHGAVKAKARRLAPDNIWSYKGDNVTVGLVETTGKAFEVATLHVEDIRSRVLESMSVVLANADQFLKNGGDMNAKFLTLAYAPMIALVGELREVTWWPALQTVLSKIVRMIVAVSGDGVLIPNAKSVAKLCQRFEVETTDGKVWMFPKLSPVWGLFFEPTEDEVGKSVDNATKASQAGLVQQKTAVQYVGTHFGVKDPQAELEAAQEEADAAAQKQADLMAQGQEALPPKPEPGAPKGPPPKKPGAPNAPRQV